MSAVQPIFKIENPVSKSNQQCSTVDSEDNFRLILPSWSIFKNTLLQVTNIQRLNDLCYSLYFHHHWITVSNGLQVAIPLMFGEGCVDAALCGSYVDRSGTIRFPEKSRP